MVWGKRSGREGLSSACSLLLTSFGLLALPGLFLLARHHSKTVRLLEGSRLSDSDGFTVFL